MEFFEMTKRDRLRSGEFRFSRNGVAYGDAGIEGLRHLVPLSQTGFLFTAGSGTPTADYRFDGEDGRTPLRVTGHADACEAHLYLRFQLPLDWGSWPENPLTLATYRSSDLVTSMTMTWLDEFGAADGTLVNVSVRPASEDTWERFPVTAPAGGAGRGRFATLRVVIAFDAAAGAEFAELADWALEYLSGPGNVQ